MQVLYINVCEDVVDALLKAQISLSLPHEPQLEHIHLPAALYRLVSSVVGDIVQLVLLEQVGPTER